MYKLKTAALALLLSGAAFETAVADEYYTSINTANVQKSLGITAVNTALPVGKTRTAHAFIITNTDTTPVTVTFTKLAETAKVPTGVAETQSTIIVAATKTEVIPFPSGIVFAKTKATIADDLQVELTTTSTTPNIDLTVDYKDN